MRPLSLSAARMPTNVPYPLDRSLSNRIRPRLAPMSCRNIPASIDARKIAAPGAKRPIATIAAKGKNPESPQPSPKRTPPSNALPLGTSTCVSPCPPRSGRDSRRVSITTSMPAPIADRRPRPRVRFLAPSGFKKPSRSVGWKSPESIRPVPQSKPQNSAASRIMPYHHCPEFGAGARLCPRLP